MRGAKKPGVEVERALDDRLDASDERTQLVEVALDRRAEAREVVGPDVVVHPDVERLEQVGRTGCTEAVGEALASLRRVPAVHVGSRSTQLDLALHRECEERIGRAPQLGGDHTVTARARRAGGSRTLRTRHRTRPRCEDDPRCRCPTARCRRPERSVDRRALASRPTRSACQTVIGTEKRPRVGT